MDEQPLQRFVRDFCALLQDRPDDERQFLARGEALLSTLVKDDSDWLPLRFRQPHPQYYQQYLLHLDPDERFCVVSFVWGPGQKTPVHDHCVWGLIGVYEGAETGERFERHGEGRPMRSLGTSLLTRGQTEYVSPTLGDIHRVANAYPDRTSISIHVYGADIGKVRRHVFDPQTGKAKEFVSGYADRWA